MAYYDTLQYAKLSPNAISPARFSHASILFDIFSAYDYTIRANGATVINTELQMRCPTGYCIKILPVVIYSYNRIVITVESIINPNYNGPIKVTLCNYSSQSFRLTRGTTVAQIVMLKALFPILEQVPFLEPAETNSNGSGCHSGSISDESNIAD
jgi:dUTPase